ncbi:hybrid sensor histidine kinase/response regulator [Lacrimispora sp. 210928-DFI.3.58]|uniref:hybrid sensor histidine kinase/response regulator n=1 Tax=Lacrimispora sp. 210928-DFI.3.58 TaxID=2883214 RepID=UPI0015B702C0|nr:hybrid sensor histidine kinase/response regulator [Lacrimispora sp. 210928-DFI.3.58]MCB7318807.1 response regulator [Lacrimispora sp. 210928-DFI.3.58]
MQSDNNRKMWMQILFACILLAFVVFISVIFTKENNERIIRQNENYVEDVTVQMAERIDDILASAQNSINTMAYLYGKSLESPEVDANALKDMAENSVFEYVEFVDKNGIDLTFEGKKADVSDREYYIEGMKGNSGVFVTLQSRITNETLVSFYTPLRYKDEIIGVLNGIYGEEGMRRLLSTKFFGTQAKTYLCTGDGTVISSFGDDKAPKNMLDALPGTIKVSEESLKDIRQAFEKHESCGYRYDGKQGTGNAYLTGISQNDWMLMQTFPSAVTNNMIEKANAAGIQMEGCLIFAFSIYILGLIFLNWKQKKLLVSQKQEMSRIVDGVTNLFTRFVVVDLKNDTYEYLKNRDKEHLEKGKYSDLAAYFSPRYIVEDGAEDMPTVISKDYIQLHMDENTPYLQFEYRIQRESQCWEHISILSLERENGVPTIILYAIQDVTELKREELRNRTALKEAFQAAEAANHAKSDFLSRMSHDIRTPMNAIMGMTAVAAMNIDDKERLKDCLNKITLSSRHLLALINDVLDMSKIESGKVTLSEEEFDMAKMVENLLAIIHPQIQEKNQQLKVNISNITHEDVIGDLLHLQQVFVNIMGNAVKFTPEGGTISFSICEKPSCIEGSGCYEFIFEDTGIGMKEEFVETIFEPFARENRTRSQNIEGTGLGMSIANNIVRMMNGSIQVESTLGVGSKFTVRLYLKLQNVKTEVVKCLKDLKVLVADDEPDACESACEILRGIGMSSDGVLSGDEAIRKLSEAHENAEDYAVVILDWKMPGKCGVETAREIRRQLGHDVPIIILSAYDWSSIEQEAREAGVNAFIAKPLFKSRLIYVLKFLIEKREEEEKSDIDELGEKDYSGKRVLLVEDGDLNLEIAETLLEFIGIAVETARDGQQAVDILLEKPENYFDLVLMDIQMPNKNGYEATKEIRASAREDLKVIPIVAMSADAFSDDIQRALSVGMNDHVAKPIELPKLSAAIEKWIK